MKPAILLVEDEAALVTLLTYNLEKAGFEVRAAMDGEEAMTMLAERLPDLVVLDWMLPKLSGLEVCRQIRRGKATARLPVVMLTAKGEEADKLRGLETGADDFMTKPFSPKELIARIKAVLRRTRPATGEDELAFADLRMDLAAHRVTRAGREVHLGPTEFRLLRHFLENPGRVFSREQILDAVWGPDSYVEPRTVDVHIRRLRKALNSGAGADLIRTVRAAGYSLDRPSGAAAA
jgi:two-component system, OmpR family, phosphate regulon response regulator PhoB